VAVPWNNAHTESGLKSTTGKPSPVRVEMNNLGGGWSSGGGMGVKAPMLDTFNYPVNNRGGNSQVILHQVPPGKYDLYLYGHKPEPLYYGDYTLTVGGRSYGRKTTFHEDDSGQNTEWVEGSQYVKFAGIKVAPGDKIDILIRPGGETTVGRLSAQGVLEMNIQVPVQEGEMLEQKRHIGVPILDEETAFPSLKRAGKQRVETGPGTATWGGGDGGSGPIGPNFHSGPSKMRMVPGGIRRTFADAMICGLQLIPVK
jgi:hypothetical protein